MFKVNSKETRMNFWIHMNIVVPVLDCLFRAIFINTKRLPKKPSCFDSESNWSYLIANKWFFTVSRIWITIIY